MLEMFQDHIARGVTRMVWTAAVLRRGNKWKYYHIITFPG